MSNIMVQQEYITFCVPCDVECDQYQAKVYFKGFAMPLSQLVAECPKCKSKIGIGERSIVYSPIHNDVKIEKE